MPNPSANYMTFAACDHAVPVVTANADALKQGDRTRGKDGRRNKRRRQDEEKAGDEGLLGPASCCGFRGYLRKRLTLNKKKRLSFSLCFVGAFLAGTEYAIILPTVWQYLQQLGQTDEHYIGYVTSAFSVGSIVSHLIVGRIADQTRNSRDIILMTNLFQIFGQLLYAAGIDERSLIVARFLSGIGTGLSAALFAEVIRGTDRRERPWYVVGSFMIRQVSLLLAPAYHQLLRQLPQVSVTVGEGIVLRLHECSYPGLLMAGLWTLFQIFVAAFYFNMSAERKEDRKLRRQRESLVWRRIVDKTPRHKRSGSIFKILINTNCHGQPLTPEAHDDTVTLLPKEDDDAVEKTYENNNDVPSPAFDASSCPGSLLRTQQVRNEGTKLNGVGDETSPLLGVDDGDVSRRPNDDSTSESEIVENDDERDMCVYSTAVAKHGEIAMSSIESFGEPTSALYIREFVSCKVIPLLFTRLTITYIQTMVEAVIPPMLQCYFHYGSRESAYLFMAIGGEQIFIHGMLLTFSGVVNPSRTVAPRFMIVVSSFAVIGGLVGLMLIGRVLNTNDAQGLHCSAAADINVFEVLALAGSCGLLFLGIPIVSVMAVSLLPFLVDYKVQGLAQGLGRFCGALGMVLGPLWGAALVYHPEILCGGAISVMSLALVMVLLSYPSLKVPAAAN